MTLTEVPSKGGSDKKITLTNWLTHIMGNINELIGLRTGNILVNGDFERWQRGAGPFGTLGGYNADRWVNTSGGASPTITQETATTDGTGTSLKLIVPVSGQATIYQRVERYAQYRGKTLSLSVRVNQSVASGLKLGVYDGVGFASYGAASATTGAWVTLTFTFIVNVAATMLQLEIASQAAGTYYLDRAMLVPGSTAADHVPEDPAIELMRCQRYYEVHGGINGAMYVGGYNAAGAGAVVPFRFSVPKGGTPTVTKGGIWAVTNCGQPTVATVDAGGYSLQAVITATGAYSFNCNSTDDVITAEWSP